MRKRLVCLILSTVLWGWAEAQAGEVEWIRAAYWDGRYPAAGWTGGGEATRDALQAAGYEILNADQLKTWMQARIADGQYSVVVFCRDTVPDTVTESRSPACTIRQYLDAGGKIIWYADIPFYYQGYANGNRVNWGDAGATDILGFATASAPRNSNQIVTLTPAGVKWGLTQTWQSQRPALPTVTSDLTILATDNSGNAAAWVKPYVKGDTFRGFVRFFDRSGQPNVGDIMRVAEYVGTKASNPRPADGAAGVSMALLQWDASSLAVFHNVYLGTAPELTEANLVSPQLTYTMYFHVPGLEPGATYYWRVDEVEADGTVRTGNLWRFSATPRTAWAPQPGDGTTYVDPNVVLKWSAGANAVGHDLYLGTDRTAVEAGTGDSLKASGFPTTSYTPAPLARSTTYYWRVDEAAGGSKVTGPIWSFVARPVLAKADPNLLGWWKMEDEGSGTAVDYSGWDHYGVLNGPQWTEGYFGDALKFDGMDDYVDCGADASLALSGSVTITAWIRPGGSLSDVKIASNQNNATGGYKLGVNANKVEMEIRTAANKAFLNRSVTGGTVLEPGLWYHVAGVYSKGQYLRTYVNGKLDRELATTELLGASSGTFKIGRESFSSAYFWLGLIDDVRIYNRVLTEEEMQEVLRGDPRLASDRQPARDALVDIRDATALSWSPGEGAAAHDVYFGTDKAAVKAAQTGSPEYRGRQDDTRFSLDGLVAFGGSYFWRIDEVEADGTTIRPGDVWSFTVPDYLRADDFESYNDEENQGTRIYETWIDGQTNGTTSTVGNWNAPFAERVIVHGGKQSMPMDYNNINSPFYAEAEREFSPVQNWTLYGVVDLSLWFRGRPFKFFETAPDGITVSSTSGDVWGTADHFRFVYKRLTGDGAIIARVDSVTYTWPWAKAGVMIRESLDAGSAHALMMVAPTGRTAFQNRVASGGTSFSTHGNPGAVTLPYWVKLERKGNQLTAYHSSDGNQWIQQTNEGNGNSPDNPQTIVMSATVYIGVMVTSNNLNAACVAQFSGIKGTGNISGSW